MKMVNKRIFLEALTCLTRGWYLRSSDIQIPLSPADEIRAEQGDEIGKMARSLYPQGILVDEGSNTANYEKTQQLMKDDKIQVIFEATFIYKENIAKADILERINGEWHLMEVKSSLASEKIDDELIDDLTYTATILSLCGIKPQKMSLLLVSKDYRLGMDHKDFFVEVNCTEKVEKGISSFAEKIDEIAHATGLLKKPKPELIYACKDCDYFEEYCLGKNLEDPIFELPLLGKKKCKTYTEENIFQVSQLQTDEKLTAPQKRVWTAVRDKTPFLDKAKLKARLEEIIFPAYYLDFETVSAAIPIYENIPPYHEMVTQYSIHKFSGPNANEEHFEFLADYRKIDSKALAEALLRDIGKVGSVIVFHKSAEEKYIKNLSAAVPECQDELMAIISRIVDLEEIIKDTYYHPSFHGSCSIKKVLPVMVPEMSYKDLVIGDGQYASLVFAELARNKYPKNEAEQLCQELLTYCKQDTWAMVKIHEKLHSLCT